MSVRPPTQPRKLGICSHIRYERVLALGMSKPLLIGGELQTAGENRCKHSPKGGSQDDPCPRLLTSIT